MKVNELRQKFLDYFATKNHTIVRSSSLIPHGDNTLLFTNAGMNQFKDVFLGLEKRDYVRATSSQKCVRAGGKHNDLENVGYTARHHTFFEMLGNFSFGDYFKQDAIKFAWEFLTNKDVGLNLPKEKLYVTVYHTDDEAYDIWNKTIGLEPERIIRIGDKATGGSDNFWQMGETGPCGPCTEIFYDHGAEIKGGLPGSKDEDGDRYIEIWNCVFMQFNRDEHGVLNPLPKPSVDTGMGLERISAVMQKVHSNYEIDLFASLIEEAAKITATKDMHNSSLKVIADHIRSISFLIADGAIPSNEGRGYVLRRIIRRGIRHGYKLGTRTPFLHQLVPTLCSEMGDAYPELVAAKDNIIQTIKDEEGKFFQTIDKGMGLLTEEIDFLKAKTSNNKILSGDIAFKLYDTFGFPLDLTEDVCREHGISVDIKTFDVAMEKQKKMAKAAGKFKMDKALEYNSCDTAFSGYNENSIESKVVALYKNSEAVLELNAGDEGVVVLEQTVFYAESGGQVGDSGVIEIDGGVGCIFNVNDTQKIRPNVFGHVGAIASGSLKVGDSVTATIDLHKRLSTARNHSATHLLHKALREVLGTHVVQKGSLVCDGYTRFDFAHNKSLSKDEVEEVERIVNHVIMMNYPVAIANMHYDEAVKNGAMALFGEKYADEVRVVKMGEFSNELCGGTHVNRTGDIGFFSIISEGGIANGIRRIEAITGEHALKRMQKNMLILDKLRGELKAQSNDVIELKVTDLLNENKQLAKQIGVYKTQLIAAQADLQLKKVETLINGVKLLVLELANMTNAELTEMVDMLKDKIVSGIIIVGCNNGEKISLVVGVTKDLVQAYNAGKIVGQLAGLIGGKGGGRPELAIGGGVDGHKLSATLTNSREFLEKWANG